MPQFMVKYRAAKVLVKETLDLTTEEAEAWLIKYTGIRIDGKAIHKRVFWDEKSVQIMDKLYGPYGRVFVRVLEIRKNTPKKDVTVEYIAFVN